ncbi:hypothetical protein ZWY2020_055799, partial [Hordeum vulgare]
AEKAQGKATRQRPDSPMDPSFINIARAGHELGVSWLSKQRMIGALDLDYLKQERLAPTLTLLNLMLMSRSMKMMVSFWTPLPREGWTIDVMQVLFPKHWLQHSRIKPIMILGFARTIHGTIQAELINANNFFLTLISCWTYKHCILAKDEVTTCVGSVSKIIDSSASGRLLEICPRGNNKLKESNIIATFPVSCSTEDGYKVLVGGYKALQGDGVGKVEYFQPLEERIIKMKGVSDLIKCYCGLDYNVELGRDTMVAR